MLAELRQKAQNYFQQNFGIPFDELMSPIDVDQPTGKSVRGNGVYSAIKEARREDDPTLPMGAWAHELKRADWDKVSDIAVNALANKSKDLQLAAWLLEAQINKAGFDGIASCMVLMQALCECYWEELHPHMDEGDLEYRTNVIHWVNEKLLPIIRMVPITALNRGEREYHWADWEQAKRNEQIRSSSNNRNKEQQAEGVSMSEFMTAMAGTATESHSALYRKLQEALEGIEAFSETLNELCNKDAPSLNALAGLLEQIQGLIASELYKRGVRVNAASRGKGKKEGSDKPADGGKDGGGDGSGGGGAGSGNGSEGPIRDRADAYARLAQAADFLAHIEPHSPAPYLVKRAIDWGNLNTAELYHDLFVKFGGQLSIFELLGLEVENTK